jgi:hypothetical protein
VPETIEEKCQRYLNGDRHALDFSNDEIFKIDERERRKQRSAYVPSIDPASFHTSHAFVKACVIDLTANGFDQAEAYAACKERWAEHEEIGLPVTAGQQQTLDSKSWDDWFQTNFDARFSQHLAAIEKNFKTLTSIIREGDEEHNRVVADLDKVSKESTEAHNLLVKDVREIRRDVIDTMRSEQAEWIERKNRSFLAEIAEMRSTMIIKYNEDLSIVKDDVIGVVRAELAESFVQMFAEAREEIRRELRAEMAAKLKLFRSTMAKRNRK